MAFSYDGLGRRAGATIGASSPKGYWYDLLGLSLETWASGGSIVYRGLHRGGCCRGGTARS